MRGAVEIRLLAPAKINLFLELHGKRLDGYHDLETLMVSIDLCDELILRSGDPSESIALEAHWSSGLLAQRCISAASAFQPLPPVEKNLLYRALALLQKECGVNSPVQVALLKRIPLEAGLGGASADAAAALLAGNAFWHLGLSIAELSDFAAQIGSDVSFFLHGGFALCEGRGEIVTPMENLPPIWVVVVKPPFGLSTPLVYRKCEIPHKPCQMAPMLDALRNRDEFALAGQVVNRLWAPALAIESRLAALPAAFDEAGLIVHQMSGSGSSYFGVTFDRMKAIRAAAILRNRALGFTWVGRGGVKSGTKSACNVPHDTLSS